MTNEQGDEFIKTQIEACCSEKGLDFYWENIEKIVQKAIEDIALSAGISEIEWCDVDLIKDTTEFIVNGVEERFDTEFMTEVQE